MNDKELEKFLLTLKKKLKPSENLAHKIVADLNVTEKEKIRYNLQKNRKGRLSNHELILNQIHILMTKWKIAIPVALVILLAGGLMLVRFGQKPQLVNQRPESLQEHPQIQEYVQIPKEVPVPNATGTIDDTIDAMTAFAENEQVITVGEGNDASIVTIDSQAVSDFGQSFNENQF